LYEYIKLGGPRAGLNALEDGKISFPYLESNLGLPARIQSLYQLTYPGSEVHIKIENGFRKTS
jgi:hypothetical protein